MNIRLQISISIVVILALIALVRFIKKEKIQLKYALMWIAMAGIILIITWVPQGINILSTLMGVGVPINAVFFLGFCVLLVIVFILTMLVSKMSMQIKTLTQNLGLVEKRLRELEKKEE